MALFDFLRKKKKHEKEARGKKEHDEVQKADEDTVGKKERSAIKFQSKHVDNLVLIEPHITERARMGVEQGVYTFKVVESANKYQVRQAVETTFDVHVTGVRIVAGHQKPRRRGLTKGSRKGYKKAMVALRDGDSIDLF